MTPPAKDTIMYIFYYVMHKNANNLALNSTDISTQAGGKQESLTQYCINVAPLSSTLVNVSSPLGLNMSKLAQHTVLSYVWVIV